MELQNINRLADKLADKFMKISLLHTTDDSHDFVCKLSYIYKEVIDKSDKIKTTLIDFKQFKEVNEYIWQTLGLNGDKCLLIFLNTENEDDFTFYKLVK